MKTRLRQCHLAVALVTGIFFIISGLTGAALIYARPIQRLINPQYWMVVPQSATMSLDTLHTVVVQQLNQPLDFITVEGPATNLAWQARLQDRNYASINPYSGEILLQYRLEDTFYGFSMALHRWLLFSPGKKRHSARQNEFGVMRPW